MHTFGSVPWRGIFLMDLTFSASDVTFLGICLAVELLDQRTLLADLWHMALVALT